MKPTLSLAQAADLIPDGASVMIGGFMCCGQPLSLIEALCAKGVKNLTVICNDAGKPGVGVAKLVEQGRVKRLIASHIGLNPVAGEKMHKGEMEVELVPQGTLAERIRAAGAGLGGILTPTGLGTLVAENKRIIYVDGRDYVLETPLRADFALIYADICDEFGNAFIAKTAKNFNIIMAMAARHTIVEAQKIVPVGALDPENVHIPSVFVKTLVSKA